MNIEFDFACIVNRKQFSDRRFRKCVKRENLDEGRQICSDAQLFAGSCHSEVYADGGPELQAHRVLAGPIECLDTQAMFEPAEEQLDLPTLGKRPDGCHVGRVA